MNPRNLLPLTLLFSLGTATAQGDKPPAGALHTLTLHPKAGTKVQYAAHSESSSDIDMGGQAMSMNHDLRHTFVLEVLEVDKEGKLKLKVTFEKASGKIGLPTGQQIDFDSTKKPDGDGEDGAMMGLPGPAVVHAYLSSIVGKPFDASVSAHGQDLQIAGLEETIDAAAKKAGPGGQMLASAMNSGIVKREVDLALARYPSKPVAIGATWEAQVHEPARKNRPATSVVGTWKLEKCDADSCLLSMTGKLVKEAAKDAGEDDPTAKMRIENSKVEGTTHLTGSDGMANKGQLQIKADLFLPNPMGGGDEMKVTQKHALTVERAAAPAKGTAEKEGAKKDGAPAKK
jgi:hypothetical protein